MSERPALLDEAIEAHGGLERWRSVGEVEARVRSGGFLIATRCRRGTLSDYRATVTTAAPHTVLGPHPRSGQRGIFEPQRVWIEDDDGRVVAERADPRSAWPSLRRNLRWDDLDILYFAGYALWNYLTTPFLLAGPGFELREFEPTTERGERRRRLHAVFPPEIPTHSPEQVFHFDEGGLLRRHDYTASVVGGWAKAAHYCDEHRSFDGLVFPTRRRVYSRLPGGGHAAAPTLVRLDLTDVGPR